MTATLLTTCDYQDGYISPREALDEEIVTSDFRVIEQGLLGWGESNAVVKVDGLTYLARVE